jgi:hypothetical protein
MFHIACTRFNNTTYYENMRFRNRHDIPVIYGSTLPIRDIYHDKCLIFVIEMNNDINKIEGIGLIKNMLVLDKRYKIYENDEYNRHIYKGQYWLSRDQINIFNSEIVDILDNALFKRKSHLKCRIGITIITDKLLNRWEYELSKLKSQIKLLFLNYFKNDMKEIISGENSDKIFGENSEKIFEENSEKIFEENSEKIFEENSEKIFEENSKKIPEEYFKIITKKRKKINFIDIKV